VALFRIWGKKGTATNGKGSPPPERVKDSHPNADARSRPLFADSGVEALTQEIGRNLLQRARAHRAGIFSSRFWSSQLIDWAMKDSAFKVQLFRFVDVFPMLIGRPDETAAETAHSPSRGLVYDYLLDYLHQPGVTVPPGMGLGLRAGGLAKGLFARTVANQIEAMAANFIAGTDAASALATLRQRWSAGMAFSVDLLGEICVSDEEARRYQQRYLDLIATLPGEAARWPANPRLETDHLGPVPRTNVSLKISALDARTDAIDFEGSIRRLLAALRPMLEAAARQRVLINFDMEQSALKDLTLELFCRCCETIDFPAGLALQAYLRSGREDASRIIRWARQTGRQVTVRLIKGAYWDYEVIHAERMGWPVPVWTCKRDTDACFEQMAEQFVAAMPRRADEGGVKLAVGSHNVRSIARVLSLLTKYDFPQSAVELQMLFGMADQLKAAVLERGLRLREYVPVGKMIPGMAYLVRRLLENTSNQSWLRAGFFENVPAEELLTPPEKEGAGFGVQGSGSEGQRVAESQAERHALSPVVGGLGEGRAFVNEPVRDFSEKEQREHFAAAIQVARVPEVQNEATAENADRAIGHAAKAFPGWRDADPLTRATYLIQAAARMRDRRDELAGIMIHEAGKTWREADADVCEAIDFCEYYSHQAVGLFRPQRLGRFVGEWDEIWYEPRGVAVVISPWNFPMAILTGMTTAALVTGNPAIVKPSTQTRGIAQAICEVLWQSGVPRDVLQLLPGPGGEVGKALVRDPRVALIAFTGSKQVGLEILETAGQTPAGQGHIKKVVCEMGGKNAIIVDESADLDEAVLGVRQSAFGYSGQKCSACSRVIVLDAVADLFLRRLVEATRTLTIGDPREPSTDVGPLIDENAAQKIREYLEVGQREGRLELACEVPAGLAERVGKPYVGPHIFSGIGPQHRLFREEIFGPVLAVTRARRFEEALDLANAVDYKLTGGVFSRKPSHLAAARQQFRVGNLYLNRGITGALVGRQPFGGFGLSGVGTKAGGPDYLLHFVQPRAVTENTMRHGFAPGMEG
jgi:RHH-type proline utilization regulon transcriptional repressor/proline dehydrogenase/delta 1-pyrroline-5-carboxylate dehydrogenase